MRRSAFVLVLVITAAFAFAQDAATTDPQHYRLQMENEYVRVLHVHYGPHEKSPLLNNPRGVLVLLSEAHLRYTPPAGPVRFMKGPTGETMGPPAGANAVENLSDKPVEAVFVEPKQVTQARKK